MEHDVRMSGQRAQMPAVRSPLARDPVFHGPLAGPRPPHRCLDRPMCQAEFVPKRDREGAPLVDHISFKVHNCARFRHNYAYLDLHLGVLLR